MENRIEGPWCKLKPITPIGEWCTPDYGLFACNDFWRYFDWQRPKRGEEMRLVFSKIHVKGAQKTLVRNDLWGRVFIVGPRTDLGMYIRMSKLIRELEPRDLFEFNVWWWPEYREGSK